VRERGYQAYPSFAASQVLIAGLRDAGWDGGSDRPIGQLPTEGSEADAAALLGDGGRDLEEARLAPAFAEPYKALQDHLFVGLCEPECCVLATVALQYFMLRMPGGHAIFASPTMQGSLLLLHQPLSGEAHRPSLQVVAAFIRRVGASGDLHRRAALDLLAAFSQRYPALYAQSPLRATADALARV
jgi:hypothetical protein